MGKSLVSGLDFPMKSQPIVISVASNPTPQETKYGPKLDIWSVGCILAEPLGGNEVHNRSTTTRGALKRHFLLVYKLWNHSYKYHKP